jgi:hypothetical protein
VRNLNNLLSLWNLLNCLMAEICWINMQSDVVGIWWKKLLKNLRNMNAKACRDDRMSFRQGLIGFGIEFC